MISVSICWCMEWQIEDRDYKIQTTYHTSEEHLLFKYVQSTDFQVQNEDVVWGEDEIE